MQSVSSRIWTLVVVSISYNDNSYTTGISIHVDYIKFPRIWSFLCHEGWESSIGSYWYYLRWLGWKIFYLRSYKNLPWMWDKCKPSTSKYKENKHYIIHTFNVRGCNNSNFVYRNLWVNMDSWQNFRFKADTKK